MIVRSDSGAVADTRPGRRSRAAAGHTVSDEGKK
jgi:hypothetical protein